MAFLDAGALGDTAGMPMGQEFRTSACVGLRYLSPIGPLGFVHGWKLDREPGESAGRFHVSIGYIF